MGARPAAVGGDASVRRQPHRELDFQAEARNLAAVSSAIRRHQHFVVPQAVPALTRRRVLVMDWIEGTRLTDATATLANHDRQQLARALLGCFLDQILVVGTFHADPHPGNLYLTGDGRIALLDCGSIGRLDRRQQTALQAVLLAVDAQDAARLRDALRQITTTQHAIDGVQLEHALGEVLLQHLDAGAMLGGALFAALMGVMREFGLAVEPVVGGALRALATLQSTFQLLAPDLRSPPRGQVVRADAPAGAMAADQPQTCPRGARGGPPRVAADAAHLAAAA
jgi:ubiquinone biosynthesis protein